MEARPINPENARKRDPLENSAPEILEQFLKSSISVANVKKKRGRILDIAYLGCDC